MAGIHFAFHLIVFVFCFAAIAMGALIVFFFIPLTLYVAPYCFWIGKQNCAGRYKDHQIKFGLKTVKNATKLYKSWVTHQEPHF